MPHIKIGFPSPPRHAAGANNGTNSSRTQLPDPCADHPYVDIEQMTSTKMCTGPFASPDHPLECRVGAFGTVRIVERVKVGCCKLKRVESRVESAWNKALETNI